MSNPNNNVKSKCHPDEPHEAKGLCRRCYQDRFRTENRRTINEKKRAYNRKFPEIKSRHDVTYYEKNKSKIKEAYHAARRAALEHLGSKCVVCGFDDLRALHIDHVNSDGYEDRSNGGNCAVYKRVLTDTTGKYQILCANHNSIKMYECNEHRGGPIVRPRSTESF